MYCTAGDGSNVIRVVSFNLDRVQRDNTWLEYGEKVAIREDYTLCLRFNLKVFRLLSSVIYLLDKDNYDNAREFPSLFCHQVYIF